MATNPPPPIESQILQFKELFKLKTLPDESKKIYRQPTQLIVAANNYGAIFIGERSGIKIILTNKLYEDEIPKLSRNTVDKYCHRNVALPSTPSHMDISSDQKRLAVTFCLDNTPVLRVYNVESFFQANITLCNEVRLSATNATFVVDLSWNPAIPNIISCCVSDGALSVYTFFDNGTWEVKSLARDLGSTCVCWSPKGKQIVVGNSNGYLTRYSPELTPVQNFPPPASIFGHPCTLCSVKWLSSFQFICAYKLQNNFKDENGGDKLCVIVVNTPKNAPVQYINYEDPCFSSGSERASQFYFIHVPRWRLIFVTSSNGVELAVLGLNQDGVSWSLWNLDEGTRVQLPMSKGEETYPIGVSMDYSSQIQTPVGEHIVPMPTLSVLTCEGLLCVYLINNLNPSCPSICEKAAIFSPQYFTSSNVVDEQSTKIEATVTPTTQHFIQNNAVQISTRTLPVPTFQNAINTVHITSTPSKDTIKNIPSFVSMSSVPHPQIATPPSSTLANLLSTSTSLFNATSSANALQTILSTNNLPTITTTTNSEATIVQQTMRAKTSSDTAAQKIAADAAKARIEQIKKFRKIIQIFETEMREISSLVETIRIENGKSNLNEKYDQLLEGIIKLKMSNSNLREDIGLVKQMTIEIFARVQDIKTKHWQYTNARYQNLTCIQDLDITNENRLKSIENEINYARSQVEKANKLLEDIWSKFEKKNDRSTKNEMPVPLVDNIYETIVKQQKVYKMLQVRTQQYEKKIKAIELLIAKTRTTKSPVTKSHDIALRNDWFSADLVKLASNLRVTDDDEEDPRILARKYCVLHAERFHLSATKRFKLQELHSSINNITYIQSNRLQKLKRKSLIMLSKSSCVEESSIPASSVIAVSEPSLIDKSHSRAFSPISSDEFDVKTIDEKIVSSTPVKISTPKVTFNMETPIKSTPVVSCFTGFGTESKIATNSISLVPESKPKLSEEQTKPTQLLQLDKETIGTCKMTTMNVTKPTQIPDVQVFMSVPNLSKNTQPAVTSTFESVLQSALAATSSVPKTDTTASTFSFGFRQSEPPTASTPIFAGQGLISKPQSSIFKTLGDTITVSPVMSPAVVPSTSTPTVGTAVPSIFGGTGSIFKANTVTATTTTSSLASNINFGSILSSNPSNPIFSTTKTTAGVLPTTTKNDTNTFITFSFASLATPETTQPTVTVDTTEAVASKETTSTTTAPVSNSVASNFSFSSISSFTPIKTSAQSSNILPIPTMVKPEPTEAPAIVPSSNNSVPTSIVSNVVPTVTETITIPVTTLPSESVLFSPTTTSMNSFSTSSAMVSPVSTITAPQKTTPFKSSDSLQGELGLGSVLTTMSVSSPVFGGLDSASATTSTPSLFRSGNIFSQSTNVPVTSTSESKSLFGGTSIFGGQNNAAIGETTATIGETSNLFNTSQNRNSFTSGGQGSIFGSPSIFGGGESFTAATTTSMTNSFVPANTSSGSLFGSRNSFTNSFSNPPFQNTIGTFGSPSFANTSQQTPDSTSGFGAPPSFSSISAFNKTAFGGAPTFGGSPTFGTSPPKLFGQSAPQTNTFGNTAPSQPTVFENIASENTMTFGNLAQQTSGFGSPPTFGQANTQQSSFSGSSFGGQAFSSWR